MRKKGQYILTFIFFFISSLLLFFLGQQQVAKSITGITESVLLPLQQVALTPLLFIATKTHAGVTVEDENIRLKKEIINLKEKNKELQNLQNQFKNTPVVSSQLIPAQIVGMRGFIPGVSTPLEIHLNKGRQQGVKKGMAVISEDKVVGKVVNVSERVSQVRLITSPESIVAANTLEHDALGLIKGQGAKTLILQNVVLADKLSIGDTVITGGDIDTNGLGFPPGLILGKITSIAKTPSALFQAAEVENSVDVTRLSTVFIVLP